MTFKMSTAQAVPEQSPTLHVA